jgi:nucleotide-binding universal stress UspA family protein
VALVNEQHFDLLVVGFMGHTRLYQQIIGSTTERLVRFAPCSVLVVK